MEYGPEDIEREDLLDETIYEEVDSYFDDDLVDMARNAGWE